MSRFSSLRVRLILIIVLAVLPMAGLILYTGVEERRYAAADALREVMHVTRFAAVSQDRSIGEGRHLLAGLAQLHELWDLNADTCGTLLVAMLKGDERYSNLGLVNRNGDVVCSALPMKGPVNIADTPEFQRAIQTREFTIGAYQLGRITGKSMLSLNYPVFDAGGQLQGVLFAALDLGWFNQLVAQTDLPQGSTLKVLDRNGRVLVHYPDPKKWIGESVAESPMFKAILAQQGRGTAEGAGLDGTPLLYAFTSLRGGHNSADAYVSVGIPTSVAYAEVKHIQNRNLTGLGILALVALGVAWAAGHMFILRHVKGLVTATRRLAAGDLSVRSDLPYGRGELGQLAQSFDEMAAALERREAEIKRAEDALRASEALYREAQRVAYIGHWDLDISTGVPKWSEEIFRIFGLDPGHGEPSFEAHKKIIHPDDWDLLNHAVTTASTQGVPFDVEFRLLRADKSIRWMKAAGRPVRDREGRIARVFGTAQDITDRKQAEEALRVSLEKYRVLFESFPLGITISDKSGKIIEANRQSEHLLGMTREAHAQRRIDSKEWQIIRKDGTPLPVDEYASTMALRENRLVENVEMGIVKEKGEITWISVTAAPIPLEGYGVAIAYGDITERKKAEEQIQASLEEKKVLLREIHHRVKNNMQVIISLLRLQAEKIGEKRYSDMFKESQDRIRTMALIHERLYQAKDFAHVNFDEYVESIVNGLFRSYGVNTEQIILRIKVQDVSLDLEHAIPCGLIINELVSNSLKHAFPQGRKGELRISLRSIGMEEIELMLGDDGVGIPEDLDIEKTDSLGLHLVSILVEHQLGGEIDLNREGGTEYRILFRRRTDKGRTQNNGKSAYFDSGR